MGMEMEGFHASYSEKKLQLGFCKVVFFISKENLFSRIYNS